MDDLITLSCPSCGSQLKHDTNTNTHACDYLPPCRATNPSTNATGMIVFLSPTKVVKFRRQN